MHCAHCLGSLEVSVDGKGQNHWHCTQDGEVMIAVTPWGSIEALRPLVAPRQRAVRSAIDAAQVYVRHCKVCKTEFTSTNKKHRFCRDHLPAFLKRPIFK